MTAFNTRCRTLSNAADQLTRYTPLPARRWLATVEQAACENARDRYAAIPKVRQVARKCLAYWCVYRKPHPS